MYIAVDFDGTCVKHQFPEVGEDIGAVPVLKELVEAGHKLILCTMRSHPSEKTKHASEKGYIATERDTLQDAVDWFEENGIELYGVNENPSQKAWTESKKIYANMYIDDCALGVPLVADGRGNVFVDWEEVRKLLVIRKVL